MTSKYCFSETVEEEKPQDQKITRETVKEEEKPKDQKNTRETVKEEENRKIRKHQDYQMRYVYLSNKVLFSIIIHYDVDAYVCKIIELTLLTGEIFFSEKLSKKKKNRKIRKSPEKLSKKKKTRKFSKTPGLYLQ
ncbi:unnamed protein product [Mytilus coruscus]|uniref:Uncharacterized protein n=1 Tax=Mytilus coruscus TaxID=42192 RepID=A0A6J8D2Q3_MYTCO|nr:unnamed protein product [Mytilus coruscus]